MPTEARETLLFQSTPPVKAATVATVSSYKSFRISIHAAREGGDLDGLTFAELSEISIHAAREGGDLYGLSSFSSTSDFNPRRP